MDLRYTRRDLDPVAKAFYERLTNGEFTIGRCGDCGHISFPPREFCPACGSDHWELMPHSGRGALHAFTTQERGFRFVAPEVLGLVDLEGHGVKAFGVIKARYEDLSIGTALRFDPVTTDDDWTLPAWVVQ